MAEEYDVGEAFLRILPSFSGVQAAIDREAQKWGLNAGREFARSFNDTAAAQIRDVNANVRVNTGDAEGQLRRVNDQLGRLPDEVVVRVRADTSDAEARLRAARAASNDLSGSHSISFDAVTGPALAGIATIRTALLALSAGAVITPIIAGGASLLGPAAAGLAGIGGVAAASIPGIHNVTEALKDQTKEQQAAGAAAVRSSGQSVASANAVKAAELSLADTERRVANDRISSAEAVKNAQKGVADARKQAAQGVAAADQQVADAERNLAQAQQASLDAQKALTDARDAAKRSLQDQANSVKDAQLTLQQDQLAVQQAQAAVDAVNANPAATDMQRKQAALALAQAQQALAEQQIAVTRAVEDNTKAQKAGVDGSPQVVAAQKQIAAAQQQALDAQKALAKAHKDEAQAEKDGAEQIKKAQQQLADARRAAALQQAQDASELQRAQMAVASAQDAANTSATTGAAATSNLAAAMAKLTPEELKLLGAVKQFKTAFVDFGKDLEPAIIPVFTDAMRVLTRLLPTVEPFIRATARALGSVVDQISAATSGRGFHDFIATLSGLVGPALSTITTVAINLGKAFGNIVTAFAPLSSVVEAGLVDLSSSLADAAKSPGVKTFVATMTDLAPTIIDTFKSLGGLVGQAAQTLAPLAKPVLRVLDAVAGAGKSLLAGLAGPLSAAFDALAPILSNLVVQLVPPLSKFLEGVAGSLPALGQAFSDIVTALLPLLPIIVGILQAAGPILDFLAPLAPYIVAIIAAVKIWTVAQLALNFVLDANPIGLVILALAALVGGFILAWKHSETFRAIVSDAWQGIKVAISAVWENFLKPLFRLWKLQFDAIRTAVVDSFHGVKVAWNDVSSFLTSAWRGFVKTAKRLWGNIADGVTAAFGAVKTTVTTIWHDIEKVFADGVNFVTQDILNPLIRILNDVLGVFGVKIPKISKITIDTGGGGGGNHGSGNKIPFATGGVLPGYTPGHDGISMPQFLFSGGEGILVPEATRALGGDRGIQAINAMFSNRVSSPGKFVGGGTTPPPGGFGTGSVQGGITSILSGVTSGAAAGVKKVTDLIRSGAADAAIAALHGLEAPLKAVLAYAPSQFAKTLGGGMFDHINSLVDKFIRGHAPKVTHGTIPTGQHLSLIKQALGVAHVADSEVNEAAVNTIASYESGWNPTAINRVDSNWQAGHPSVGLMQTIGSTFQAYVTEALRNVGPFAYGVSENPLANMVAGIRYAVSRYGSLPNVPGVASLAAGGGYVGYDAGGFLPPGVSAVYNATGKPEPVFTSQQWATMKNLANRSAGGQFEGALYLDSGEFLGMVRGQVDDSLADVASQAGRMA